MTDIATLRAALDDEKERNGLYLATLDAMNVDIATLRAALDGLVEVGDRLLRYSGNSLMTEAEQEDWIALRAALAATKETP